MQATAPTRPRLTIAEVCDRLDIAPRTLYRWMEDGVSPPYYRLREGPGPNWIRFDEAEFEAWLRRHRRNGPKGGEA